MNLLDIFSLLLLMSSNTVDGFMPKRHRKFLTTTKTTKDTTIDLHVYLQLRGGDADDETAPENSDDAVDEVQDSDEASKEAWKEEIKRTQSFYQEQSVTNNDTTEAAEDVRGYGNSESSSFEQNIAQAEIEEEDDDEAQADDDSIMVDDVEKEDNIMDTEENDNEEADTAHEVINDINEEVIAVEAVEEASETDSVDEVIEEERDVKGEDLQVEVAADEEQSTVSEGDENMGEEDAIVSEEDDVNDYTVEIQEVVVEEEEVKDSVGEIAAEDRLEGDVNEADTDQVDDTLSATSENEVVYSAESNVSTPEEEQDQTYIAVQHDESNSLVRKASALLQVILLRGQIALSKNKRVQYLSRHKSKVKVIALASLGGVLSLLARDHFFVWEEWQASDDMLELPGEDDEWIEEEDCYAADEVEEADGR